MCPFLLISSFWRETEVTISDVQCSHLWWDNIISTLHVKIIESLHLRWVSHPGLPSSRHKLTQNQSSSNTAWHRREWASVGAVWHVREKKDKDGKRGRGRMLFQQEDFPQRLLEAFTQGKRTSPLSASHTAEFSVCNQAARVSFQ